MPIIIAVLIAIVWIVLVFFLRNFKNYCSYVVGTFTVVFFLIQNDIYIALFQVFNCYDVNGTFRLRMDINEVCYTGEHSLYAIEFGLPGIFFYGVVIPGLYGLYMCHMRNVLKYMDKPGLSTSDLAKLQHSLYKIGFLIAGYKPNRFWYEMINTSKKILVILLTTFAGELSGEL